MAILRSASWSIFTPEPLHADGPARYLMPDVGSAMVTGTINATLPRLNGRLDGTVLDRIAQALAEIDKALG